jgi:hypothetical protein
VQEVVFKYVREVHPDLCIKDITEDVADLMFHAFHERPKDPKVVKEMGQLWEALKEKGDG